MEIEILEQQCGGTEFVPRPHRLHLGAQNAEGVDRLQFILPAAWAGCTLALYLRRSDGVQLAAIPLDADDSVTVDRRLTGSVRGQWMLAAIGSGGCGLRLHPHRAGRYGGGHSGRRQHLQSAGRRLLQGRSTGEGEFCCERHGEHRRGRCKPGEQ